MTTRSIEFALYQVARDALDAALVQAGKDLSATREALAKAQGIAAFGPMNLTPESIRLHPDYRRAHAALNSAFEASRRFNGQHVKRFGPELRAERDAKRAA
jgi:hypothetical protein